MANISRRALGLGAVSALALVVTGLPAWAQDAEVEAAIAWAQENLPASTPEIIRGAAEEGQLDLTLQVFGDDQTTRAMIAKFNEHYPFINVTYTMQNGAQIVKKFSAEINSGRGISDYLQLQSDQITLEDLISQGAVAEFVISQDAAYPDDSKLSGLWYPWLRQSNVTVYRPDALTDEEKDLVRTYEGLGDPRFKGRIGIISASTSNGRTGSYLLQFGPDPSLWDKLVANEPIVKPSSAPLLDGMLAGEYDVALMSGFPTAVTARKAGAPIEFLISTPSPVLFAPGVVSALAPHPNAARLFQDWAMSAEGAALWTGMVSVPPARSDVADPEIMQEPWFFDDRSVNRPLDWQDYGEKGEQVLERFQAEIQGG